MADNKLPRDKVLDEKALFETEFKQYGISSQLLANEVFSVAKSLGYQIRRQVNNDRVIKAPALRLNYAHFILDLMAAPHRFADGAVLFVDPLAHQIIYKTKSNQYVPLCTLRNCTFPCDLLFRGHAFCSLHPRQMHDSQVIKMLAILKCAPDVTTRKGLKTVPELVNFVRELFKQGVRPAIKLGVVKYELFEATPGGIWTFRVMKSCLTHFSDIDYATCKTCIRALGQTQRVICAFCEGKRSDEDDDALEDVADDNGEQA